MRISDWSSDVCSSDLGVVCRATSLRPCDRHRLAHGPGGLRPRHAVERGHPRERLPRGRYPSGCWSRIWPALRGRGARVRPPCRAPRSEEHTSELQSLMRISYAVFCLNKKTTQLTTNKLHSKPSF